MRGNSMSMEATAHRAGTTRMRGAVALRGLAALTAGALAGCGGPGGVGAQSPDGDRASEPRSASAQPSVSAADGHDTGACSDGNCEIAVFEPVTIRFDGPAGATTLSVTEVGPDRIEYALKSGNGRSKGGAEGPGQVCLIVLRSNGSSTSCGGEGDGRPPSAQPDAVVIRAATGEDGTALLHVVSD
ncbi:hypothetical protein JL475_20065 [Streptomyces sp. M2CJ-2]|uniref:hypothetical protein n=1 Tax=Streptomyces sp. M2CJ-2 TaxID=2803948 RepID=UPI0019272834|nr:hypothetical protein [Streptomyces sp. M2CJ-2]MBL3668249.1 hypothetical protein [Streptomyces sp. M2CJ-2]